MDKVFVDAAAWIALLAPGDNLRQQADAAFAELERQNVLFYTTEFVLLLEAGWALYKQRPDKDWGLTDCISFVVMQREVKARAFTSDQHFAQAGFVKLLQN